MQPFNQKIIFTGTQINYFTICPTKLWYFSHFLQQEHNSELVALGKLLHETSFCRNKKDVLIDSKIALDFIEKNGKVIVHDVKKSKKMSKAHIYQMLYYLYYLKQKGIDAEGQINYPTLRKVERVALTTEKVIEIENMLKNIKQIIAQQLPPEREKRRHCRKCSYFEFCWC